MSEQTPIEIRTDNYFAVVPHWVLDTGISSTAFHLYAVLLSYSNWKTKDSWPSRATLAQKMTCSIKTVDRAKDELVEKGLLVAKRRANKSNYYTVITANPHSDKNDISLLHRDKNDIPRGDKNDTLTIINNYIKTGEPEGSQPEKDLGRISHKCISLYLKHYDGEFSITEDQKRNYGKNIKDWIRKGITEQRLEELIPLVAQQGWPIAQWAFEKVSNAQEARKPITPPTPTPPPFTASDVPQGVPMPDYVKDLQRKLTQHG